MSKVNFCLFTKSKLFYKSCFKSNIFLKAVSYMGEFPEPQQKSAAAREN